MQLGLLGAWSIDNPGDVILHVAVRQALGERLRDARLIAFAPQFPQRFWRHDFRGRGAGAIRPIRPGGTVAWASPLDAVVIGGGGLIGFTPTFACFQTPGSARWPRHVRAAWNALGHQSPRSARLSPEQRRRLVACCERLSYLSVRSLRTAEVIERCGYRGPIAVVPDPAIGLRLPGPDRTPSILRAAGAEAGEPLVGISVGRAILDARCAAFFDDVAASASRLGMRTLVLPFGGVYGDAAAQREIVRRMPRTLVLRQPIPPLDTWRLVGALCGYVASRFHAMLAAYSQDVPFVVLDEYVSRSEQSSKILEFCADNGLAGRWTSPFGGEWPGRRLRRALLDGGSFAAALVTKRRELARHHDALAKALLPA